MFTENEKKFLSTAKSEDRNETTTTTENNIVNETRKTFLALFTVFMNMDTIGRFLPFIQANCRKYTNTKILLLSQARPDED